MSNVKRIDIKGTLPFNADEDTDMCQIIGSLQRPTLGVKFIWLNQTGYVDNEHGGKTAMYNFMIVGEEAVSCKYLDRIIGTIIQNGGTISKARFADIEEASGWIPLARDPATWSLAL